MPQWKLIRTDQALIQHPLCHTNNNKSRHKAHCSWLTTHGSQLSSQLSALSSWYWWTKSCCCLFHYARVWRRWASDLPQLTSPRQTGNPHLPHSHSHSHSHCHCHPHPLHPHGHPHLRSKSSQWALVTKDTFATPTKHERSTWPRGHSNGCHLQERHAAVGKER